MSSDSQSGGGGSYAWYARTAPMYLALLPLAIGIGVWFPEVGSLERLGAIVVSPAVLAILLGEKGRDRGRRLQPQLWESWGGPLLTQYLRHRDGEINEHLKLEYHRKLQELLPRVNIPTAAEEAANPGVADSVYDACAQHLVNVVREEPKRFWSAFKENRSQGFRRNFWGLKPLGIACSFLGSGAAIAWLVVHWESAKTITASWIVATLACTALLGLWLFCINTTWVRAAYDAYARRTLESVTKMREGDLLG